MSEFVNNRVIMGEDVPKESNQMLTWALKEYAKRHQRPRHSGFSIGFMDIFGSTVFINKKTGQTAITTEKGFVNVNKGDRVVIFDDGSLGVEILNKGCESNDGSQTD